MRYFRIWHMYGAGRTKDILRYVYSWMWLTHVLLIISIVFMHGVCEIWGGFFWTGLGLFLTAFWIKGKNYKKILTGIDLKYMRLPGAIGTIYLVVIGLPAVLEHRVSEAMYLVSTLIFLIGITGLVLWWASNCMTVLEQYYPWIARGYYRDFPQFDREKQQEHMAGLEGELKELYQNTSSPVVKEAIGKRDAAGVVWVLMFETVMLGMILMMWCES